jgi:hypothetical protein
MTDDPRTDLYDRLSQAIRDVINREANPVRAAGVMTLMLRCYGKEPLFDLHFSIKDTPAGGRATIPKLSDAIPCCPICEDLDGTLHTPDDWGFCRAHNRAWLIGCSGIFTDPDPRRETWNANREFLRQFQVDDEDREYLSPLAQRDEPQRVEPPADVEAQFLELADSPPPEEESWEEFTARYPRGVPADLDEVLAFLQKVHPLSPDDIPDIPF